jgi:hypothetical protein
MTPEEKPKLSERYWDRYRNYYKNVYEDVVFYLEESYKATYDQLLSLEAKIEVLKTTSKDHLIKFNGMIGYIGEAIVFYETEYQSLGKQHNLCS